MVRSFTSLTILFFTATASAQDEQSPTGNRSINPKTTYTLEAIDAAGNAVNLPNPPLELSKLLEAGQTRIEFYDPDVSPRAFAGETQFEYKYTYNARSDWNRKYQDGKPSIEISVLYRDVRLQRKHRIILPQELMGEDLFQRRLTLHELDHVRISADPRLPKLLEKMLKERNSVVTKVLDSQEDELSGPPTAQDLSRISKRLVKKASDRVFDDFVAIVQIRYRELDRISDSGRKLLSPEDRMKIIDSEPGSAD